MLTLVRRHPTITNVWWEKMIRLCRRSNKWTGEWHPRRRQVDALSRLDDRLLADIGLTREQQMVACSKLFWWIP